MTWDDVLALALQLPGTEPALSYGEPSLKVGRALLTRYRVADDSLVLLEVCEHDRALRLDTAPEVFFLEEHYRPYDIVLARLPALTAPVLAPLLERRWRAIAGKRRVAAWQAAQSKLL